jgi:hypothetical protein
VSILYRSADKYKARKELWVVEEHLREKTLALLYHVKLGLLDRQGHELHAAFVALTNNSDNEIHEYYIADYDNHEPQEPDKYLELAISTVNKCLSVIISD